MKLLSTLFLWTLVGASAATLSATTVTLSAPGTLQSALGGDASVTTLTISGPVNAADFDYISRKLFKLTSLDLSGATVSAYSGAPVLGGVTDSPAGELPAYALAGIKLTSVTLPATLEAIGDASLKSTRITSVTIPAGVTRIGMNAFGNSALKTVTVPSTVTTVDSLAFAGCTDLTEVSYGLSEVAPAAFKGCTALETFRPTVTIATIGAYAFADCSALAAYPFAPGLKTIGEAAFRGTALTAANLAAATDLQSVGPWAFSSCPFLATVTSPASLARIGEGAFFGDTALTSAHLPADFGDIADFLFTGDTALTDAAIIGSKTTSIGRYAYTHNSNVAEIILPSSLSYIGDNAMEGWKSLDTVNATALTAVPELGQEVWKDVEQHSANLRVADSNMAAAFEAAPQWKEFTILNASSVDGIDADLDSEVASQIKAWFEGHNLVITSGLPIDVVRLMSVDGRNLSNTDGRSSLKVTIDTSRWTDNVYLLLVELTDGRKSALKLMR